MALVQHTYLNDILLARFTPNELFTEGNNVWSNDDSIVANSGKSLRAQIISVIAEYLSEHGNRLTANGNTINCGYLYLTDALRIYVTIGANAPYSHRSYQVDFLIRYTEDYAYLDAPPEEDFLLEIWAGASLQYYNGSEWINALSGSSFVNFNVNLMKATNTVGIEDNYDVIYLKDVSIGALTLDDTKGYISLYYDKLLPLNESEEIGWYFSTKNNNVPRDILDYVIAPNPPSPPDPPDPPVFTTYRPVAYLKGNKTYNSLSMIHRAYTNNGEAISHRPLSNIERFVSGTELNAVGGRLAVGSSRIVCYSDNDNYFIITKVSEEDTLGGRQWVYDIDFYIDGTLVSALQQEYVITGNEKMYISFISDEYNELARPSFIHQYSDQYCEYNIETVSVANLSLYYEWLGTSDKNYDIPDPYQGGGDSTEEITPGNFVRQNVDTDFPTELSINPQPFFNAYLPDDGLDYQGELFQLESFLWGGLFDPGSLKKIFTNPIDTIISLHLIPLNLESSLEDEEVMLGNVNSGVEMTPVQHRFVYVDCGDIDINEYYSSYLDYAPYTKMSVYLPYIGVVPVSTDDFMNKKMQIKYGVDVETGGLLCLIKSIDKHNVSQTLYSFSGNCALSIPVTAVKHDNIVNGIISGSVALFMGGATLATGGITSAGTGAIFGGAVSSLASSVVGSKPHSQRASSLGGNVGYMGIQYPYLIIERPNQCHATAQNKYKGYPSHLTYQLSSLRGYTEIESIHLEGITCTDEELKELDGILKEGVIF